MLPFFADYLDRLEALHQGLEQVIAGLPQAALDWQPGPDMNSLAVLVMHTAGAERFWIGDMVESDPSGRIRSTEFEARDLDEAALRQRLDDVLAHSQKVLTHLTLADLERECPSPIHGRSYRVSWSLAHALEHTALHLGQMEITRQLWQQRQQNS